LLVVVYAKYCLGDFSVQYYAIVSCLNINVREDGTYVPGQQISRTGNSGQDRNTIGLNAIYVRNE
jgi:hypothetical protein